MPDMTISQRNDWLNDRKKDQEDRRLTENWLKSKEGRAAQAELEERERISVVTAYRSLPSFCQAEKAMDVLRNVWHAMASDDENIKLKGTALMLKIDQTDATGEQIQAVTRTIVTTTPELALKALDRAARGDYDPRCGERSSDPNESGIQPSGGGSSLPSPATT